MCRDIVHTFFNQTIAVHTALQDIYVHDSFCGKNRIGAIHLFRFTKMISHIRFTFFDVNCAFLFISAFAVAAMLWLLV